MRSPSSNGMSKDRSLKRSLLPVSTSLASGLCFGVIPYFAVQLFAAGFSPVSVLVWRVGLSALVLMALAIFVFPAARQEWRAGWRLALVGLLGAAQSFCFFMSMKYLPTGFATLIFFLYPLASVILERLVFGVRLTTPVALAVPLVIIGALLTLYSGFNDQLGRAGAAWALPVPILYAIFLSLSARVANPRHPVSRAIRLQVGMMAGYLCVALFEGVQAPADLREWELVLACALAGGVLGVSFFAYGIQRLGASVFGIVAALELVTVVVIGLTVLNESLRPEQVAGMLFILTAILVSAIPPDRFSMSKRRTV